MRFPDNPIMDRTFDLFERLGFTGGYKRRRDTTSPIPPTVHPDVIPYIMKTGKDIQYFNYIRMTRNDLDPKGVLPPPFDPFKISHANKGPVPDKFVEDGIDKLTDHKFDYFRDKIKEEFETGWDELMAYDKWSTRQFLQSAHPEIKSDKFKPEPYPVEVGQDNLLFVVTCS